MSHISGPVLAFAGGLDMLWESASSATSINEELTVAHSPYQHQAFIYQDAGHGEGMQPYQPAGDTTIVNLGGTRAGNVAAQRDGWPKMLAMLAGLTAKG